MSREREHFSNRLQKALTDAGYSAYGPTELAHQFNSRFAGSPISVHAARKWLLGDAIPTQDKIRVLAEWLVVPPDWLRFGGYDANNGGPSSDDALDPAYLKLIADVKKLDSHHRKLVFEFVRMVIRINGNIKP